MSKGLRYVLRAYPDCVDEVVYEIDSKGWVCVSVTEEKRKADPFCTDVVIEVPEGEKNQIEEMVTLLTQTEKLMRCFRI